MARIPSERESSRIMVTAGAAIAASLLGMAIYVVMTPILLRKLDFVLFGVYLFSQKLALFGGVANFGSGNYLKLRLNSLSGSCDENEKRNAVGDCIGQWLILSPFMLVLVIAAAHYIALGAFLSNRDVLAVALLLAVVPLSQLLAVPGIALYCEGYGYRNAAAGMVANCIGALITLLILNFDATLIAPAVGALVSTIIHFCLTHLQARSLLTWYGANLRSWVQIRKNLSTGIGVAGASLAYLGLQQYEALTLGLTLHAALVGKVLLTGTLVRTVEVLARNASQALLPRLSRTISSGELTGLSEQRRTFRCTVCVVFSLLATALVAGTDPLLGLWLNKQGVFISNGLVAFLFAIAYLRVLTQFDGQVLDQAGRYYRKTLLAAVTIVVAMPVCGYLWIRFSSVEILAAALLLLYACYSFGLTIELRKGLAVKEAGYLLLIPLAAVAGAVFLLRIIERLALDNFESIGLLLLYQGLLVLVLDRTCDLRPTVRRFVEATRGFTTDVVERFSAGQDQPRRDARRT